MSKKYNRFISIAIILIFAMTFISFTVTNSVFATENFTLGTITSASNFNANGGIGSDQGFAIARDSYGNLWGVLGNTAYGAGVGIWKGTNVDDMTKQYSSSYNFSVGSVGTPSQGAAGIAFNNINYPNGPRSRGCLWPMGLYINHPADSFVMSTMKPVGMQEVQDILQLDRMNLNQISGI